MVSRKRFNHMQCGVAQTLEQIGDWWSLLIIRDAMFGITRFAKFEASLGISKNILSNRLAKLVDHGILNRERLHEPGTRYAYHLTKKGRDLWILLTAMRLWADKWVFDEDGPPILATEKSTGRAVTRLIAVDDENQPIKPSDLTWSLGPGVDRDNLPQQIFDLIHTLYGDVPPSHKEKTS